MSGEALSPMGDTPQPAVVAGTRKRLSKRLTELGASTRTAGRALVVGRLIEPDAAEAARARMVQAEGQPRGSKASASDNCHEERTTDDVARRVERSTSASSDAEVRSVRAAGERVRHLSQAFPVRHLHLLLPCAATPLSAISHPRTRPHQGCRTSLARHTTPPSFSRAR